MNKESNAKKPDQLDHEQKSFLLAQFREDWAQYRHLENQRWKLFLYYILSPALFTLVATTYRTETRIFFPQLLLAAGVVNFFWAIFTIGAFSKWRREFILHIVDINKIRGALFGIESDFANLSSYTVWRYEEPTLAKPTSLHMITNFVAIATCASLSALFSYLYYLDTTIAYRIVFAALVSTYVALFLFEFLFEEAIFISLSERRIPMKVFREDAKQDESAMRRFLIAITAMEAVWAVGFVLSSILYLSPVMTEAFYFLLVTVFAKYVFFSSRCLAILKLRKERRGKK